jgi:PAS domain S-box-containing protein
LQPATIQTQRQAMQQIRGALGRLQSPEQLPRTIAATRQALVDCGLTFDHCGLILIDSEAPPQASAYLGEETGSLGRLHPAGAGRAVDLWRAGQVVLTEDSAALAADRRQLLAPLYGKSRSLIEVPFSHGILFLTSHRINRLGPETGAVAALMADVLSEGLLALEYRRERDASQTHYKQLVETPELVFLLFDTQRNALYISPQIEDWTGDAPDAFYQNPQLLWDIIHSQDREAVEAALDLAAAGQATPNIECRWRHPVSGRLWVSLAAFPIYDETDGAIGLDPMLQVVVQDISERKQAETALRRNHEELEQQVHQRTKALSEAVSELQREITERRLAEEQKFHLEKQLRQSQKLQAIGQLTAGIAHNFNNMLMVILGNIGVSLRDTPASMQAQLSDAESAALKAAQMVKQLMTFSRRNESLERLPVDIESLVNETLAICHKTFDRQIDLSLDITPELPMALGDASQLEQMLLNFCLNSRDALENIEDRTPRLRVLADEFSFDFDDDPPHPDATPGHYIRLRVVDNGCGMSSETRERALEPFFTTKEADRGTGLGLATAYGIIEQHRGWIEIDSSLGRGTCMAVFLPVTTEECDTEEETGSAGTLEGNETILIIDDEEDIRKLLGSILRRYNYEVLVGIDGQDGIEVYKREQPRINLVVLDLMMPRKSGREVLSEMLSLDPGAKVVVSTGIATENLTDSGAREVIMKPYQEIEILRTLRRVLDEPA